QGARGVSHLLGIRGCARGAQGEPTAARAARAAEARGGRQRGARVAAPLLRRLARSGPGAGRRRMGDALQRDPRGAAPAADDGGGAARSGGAAGSRRGARMARSVDLGGAASEKHRAARLRAPRTRTSWGRQVLVAAEASCVTSVASIHLRTRRASATRVRLPKELSSTITTV